MSVSSRIASTTRLIVGTLICAAGLCAPPANAEECLSSTQRGTYDGYFYSFWTDGGGSTNFCLQPNGRSTSQWSNVGSWVGGIGWETGGRRAVTYSGTFDSSGNSFVALYGWTQNPLIEYYIVDSWDSYRPTDGQGFIGTVVSDGGTYDVYRTQRVNAPSIEGTATFYQYWSIRQQKRAGGTITAGNHFDAWAAYDMNLGTHSYQIVATETSGSSGSSSITIGDSGTS
jgi:hypothetical protein